MIYYVTINHILILIRYAMKRRAVLRVQAYPVLLLLLFVFSAFRYEVGCDWTGYIGQWRLEMINPTPFSLTNPEPIWWGMLKLLQSLGLPYPWLNVATSAIFFGGLHFLARRQPDPLGFLVLLFPILIINLPMSGIRQGAAIGIMCIAFAAFIDKRTIRFAILTLLASMFHDSALVFLLLVPLVGGAYTKRRLLLAVLLAIPGTIVILTGEAAGQAVSRYIGTEVDSAGAIFRVGVLVITGLAYFAVLRPHWKRSFPEDYKLVSVGALIMLVLVLMLPVSSVISDRLAYYLIPLQTMIFARIPYLPLSRWRSIYAALPYIGLALIFIVWTGKSWHFASCYLPYQTWLFGPPAFTKYPF